jgi:hypothetical protein
MEGQIQEIELNHAMEALRQVVKKRGKIPMQRNGLGDFQQRAILFDV